MGGMRTRTTERIWAGGVGFPRQGGLKPLKPVTTLMVAAPTMMKTSRLMTAAVTQKGTGRWRGCGCTSASAAMIEGIERVINEVTRRSLSAMGSRIWPSGEYWLKRRAKRPARPAVTPAPAKKARAPPNPWEESAPPKNGERALRMKGRTVGGGKTFGGVRK